jgi:signal peptidase I
MSANSKNGRGKAASPAPASPQPSATGTAGRRPLVPALAWTGLSLLSIVLYGCPRFGWTYALFVVFTLGLAAAELAFLNAIWRKGRLDLFPAWKKFTGYALVFAYVFQALPRVSWGNDGLIGPGRTVFLFALSLACLVAGFAAFLIAGRPRTLAAFGVITEEEVADRALRKKNRASRQKSGFVHGLLEWVDAIAFAAIAVIVINIFVFQLYVIPSESMVPRFLVGDRPFTVKLTMGPRVPLTDWRLPFLTEPKRGDIVTIANPRYPENHEVNIKKQLSQFVYMLTFTGVNLDRLPDGSPKADPLVKRVVGVPGERLMMIDDVLYAKTAADADFKVVEADKTWASIDLWKESAALRSKIRTIPVDEEGRALLSAWDARKNSADPLALGADLRAAAARIPGLAASLRGRKEPVTTMGVVALRDDAIKGTRAEGAAYIAGLDPSGIDLSLALAAATSPEAALALATYASDAAASSSVPAKDAYEKGSRALNLLLKRNLVARTVRDLELLATGASYEAMVADPRLATLNSESLGLRTYLAYYDARNFPAFPAGGYLGPQQYFAMGDNRYDSLDFRFQEGLSTRSLDAADPSSIRYRSQLAPFALEKKFIEGKAVFILWPFNRLGGIRH